MGVKGGWVWGMFDNLCGDLSAILVCRTVQLETELLIQYALHINAYFDVAKHYHKV
jgi:hypothetical protein